MKHIVCEFCGEEFKSLGGRELHRTKKHQADQQIRCPGSLVEEDPKTKRVIRRECNAIFARPSGLIKHLEEGHCKYISKSEFKAERTQKHVVRQIMANPDAFTHNLAINQASRDAAAGSVSSTSTAANGSRVWNVSDGSVSTKLFPGAKPTPPTTNWDAVALSVKRNSREDDEKNLFRARFWDRTSKAYDPDRFLHSVIGKYCCPFPECEATFDGPLEIETHLLDFHAAKRIACPSCNKNFKTATALVQHCEASARGGKCVIARSEGYGKALDEITGGILSAQRMHEQEKIWGLNKANFDRTPREGANPIKERSKGVMDVKYEAKHPGARL
ncbi:hypothetical protein M8818_000414 [Zalaria obscura]|uniref:Uncharacterized protein n=1 Tax=Zalaria obscura TaxID=2024903 RepID=A0ACC3SMT3_9PEZI